jgi:hypothetical protein
MDQPVEHSTTKNQEDVTTFFEKSHLDPDKNRPDPQHCLTAPMLTAAHC